MTDRGDDPLPTAATLRRDRHGWDDPTDEALYGKEFGAGALVGDYVVDELRFKGGFAVIYRAHHGVTGRPAALKVLRRDLAASAEMLHRFHREAETIARINHPNLVAVLGSGELTGGQPYIVMEWLEGRSLDVELRARGPLRPAEALAVMEELGAALGAAHELGVVHRDIKAQNVVCLPRGEWFTIKLVDFGIAKLIDPKVRSDLTTTGNVVGTPLNMAPEQILGEAVDARTDVYALGLLLYQLVTGRLPFDGQTSVEIEEAHLSAPPPRASDAAPVSPAFDAVIQRCLEKGKAARYGGVPELLVELRAAVTATAAQLGAALCVEARIDPALEDPGDDVLDDVDAVLAAARDAAARDGLAVALESSNALVAATLLPADPAAARAGRERLLQAAVALARGLAGRAGASPYVTVTLTAHAAPVTLSGGRFGGALLRLDWTGAGAGPVDVVATREALDGLALPVLPVAGGRLRLLLAT